MANGLYIVKSVAAQKALNTLGGIKTSGFTTPKGGRSQAITSQTLQQAMASPGSLDPADQLGPGQPPQAYPLDSTGRLRQWAYRSGRNLPSEPREGHVNADTLKQFRHTYDLLGIAMSVRKDEIARLDWDIAPARGSLLEKKRLIDANKDQIEAARKFFKRPDKVNWWQTWIRRLLEDYFVGDYVSIYRRPTLGGKLFALELIDGATIKVLTDIGGRTPQPPSPAYESWLYGMARSNNQMAYADPENAQEAGTDELVTAEYTMGEMLYVPKNTTNYDPYGISPIEQIMMHINLALRWQTWSYTVFSDGNIPQALMAAPPNWTMDQIEEYMQLWDALKAGDPRAQRMLQFVPNETKAVMTDGASGYLTFAKEFVDYLMTITLCALDVTRQEMGLSPEGGTGLGGSGHAEAQQDVQFRRSLLPMCDWLADCIFTPILEYDFGLTGFKWVWPSLNQQDPMAHAELVEKQLNTGQKSLDEVLMEAGEDAVGVGRYILMAGKGPMFLPDLIQMSKEGSLATDQQQQQGLAEHGAGLDKDKAEHAAGLQQQTTEHGAGIERQNAEHGAGLQQATAEHGAGLERQNAEHGSGLERTNAEHASVIATDQADHGATIAARQAQEQATLAQGTTEHGAAIDRQNAEHGAGLQQVTAEHGAGLQRQNAEHAAMLTAEEESGTPQKKKVTKGILLDEHLDSTQPEEYIEKGSKPGTVDTSATRQLSLFDPPEDVSPGVPATMHWVTVHSAEGKPRHLLIDETEGGEVLATRQEITHAIQQPKIRHPHAAHAAILRERANARGYTATDRPAMALQRHADVLDDMATRTDDAGKAERHAKFTREPLQLGLTPDKQRIVVSFNHPNKGVWAALKDQVKAVPGAQFDGVSKTWSIPIYQLPDVLERLHQWHASPQLLVEATKALMQSGHIAPDGSLAKYPDVAPLTGGKTGLTPITPPMATGGTPGTILRMPTHQAAYDWSHPPMLKTPEAGGLALHEYQQQTAGWSAHVGSGIMGLAVGLGKTITSLATFAKLHEQGRAHKAVVIVPASRLHGWKKEIEQYTHFKALIIEGTPEQRQALYAKAKNYDVIIAAYSRLQGTSVAAQAEMHQLATIPGADAVIVDEAHRLKGKSSQQAHNFKSLYGHYPSRQLLTATPMPNSPEELYRMVNHVAPGKLGKYQDFLDRYVSEFQTVHIGGGKTIKKPLGYKDLDKLHARIKPYVMVKRPEDPDVKLDLPEMHDVIMPLNMNPAQRKLYRSVQHEGLAALRALDPTKFTKDQVARRHVLTILQKLEQVAIDPRLVTPNAPEGSKVEEVVEAVRDHLTSGGKGAVIFSHYKPLVAILKHELQSGRMTDSEVAVITGDTKTADRQLIENRLNDPNDPLKVIIGTDAMQEGMNMQGDPKHPGGGADMLVHMDQLWVPSHMVQRNGRVYRQNQDRPVTILNAISAGTVEEKKRARALGKQKLIEAAIHGNPNYDPAEYLTYQDLMDIFSDPIEG